VAASPRRRNISKQDGIDQWLNALREHMQQSDFSRRAIRQYTTVGRHFLKYIVSRGTRLDAVSPEDVEAYLRAQRRRYRRSHGHAPLDDAEWRSRYTASVHTLLRLAQGTWPPLTSLESSVQAFKEKLQHEQLRPDTVRQYLEQARLFLSYLDQQQIRLERATPQNLDGFLAERLRIYRQQHGQSPRRLVRWRCEYTKAIHRLLRGAQEQWPPPSSCDPELQQFEAHLIERGLDASYIQDYLSHARQFLHYLNQHKMSAAAVRPDDVAAYFRVALRIYRKRKPNLPKSRLYWRTISRRAVHGLLRFVQGEWPPGSRPAAVLSHFRDHLEQYRYSRIVIPSHVSAARQFLHYLKQQDVPVEEALPVHIGNFIQAKLERYKQRYRRLPSHPRQWRTRYAAATHRLLRMMNPNWPPREPPANDSERFQREVLDGYGRWLVDVQGLSKETLRKNGDAAGHFLRWLGDRANRESLRRLAVPEIDQYLTWRMPGLRRATRHGVSQCLRSFLRYLHSDGFIAKDLSTAVSGPIMYRFDDIPRAFTEQQVKALLDITLRDKTPTGMRDHAILLLLATYGLRAGEVVRLRLDDIDWRAERLHVRQSKTGVESFLPLLPQVGEALLSYLRRGRPRTKLREVFLRVRAPHGPFPWGGSLHTIIQRRLNQADRQVQGRHGAHAFRFARAGSLLRAAVPLKSIGDLLGHRSAVSTEIYLRLATEDLRAISIDVPGKGEPCQTGRTKTRR
jgi:integrase/recombinase XerD